ncbi:MAG TPA: glutaredoxin domain-containing protein [Methanocella sp.]|jgi:glutaredoxin-like YruB-family protein
MTSIRIFSQPTCPACNELKDYLKKKGVDFEDVDVTSNREALDEMIKVHKVRVTPLLLAGDKKIIGFDPIEVDKVLAELQ